MAPAAEDYLCQGKTFRPLCSFIPGSRCAVE